MVPDMRPAQLHKPTIILVRLCCLLLMAALLANPVLAVVSTSMDCGGQCCCADTGHGPTPTIGSNTDTNSACCGPTGSTPCHLSAGSLPDAPLALTQTTKSTLSDAVHLQSGSSNAGVSLPSHRLSISKTDIGAIIPLPPLYLQSCRLIC